MRRQAEDTITAEVRNLVSGMTHGWTIEAQQKPFVGSQRTPDIMVKRFGLETIAVEAKPADTPIEKGITKMRDSYIGSELTAEWIGISETLQTGVVIRYPEELSTASGDELIGTLINTTDIEYKLISISSGEPMEFPMAGVARGSLADIVNALHVGASPSKQIKDAAQAMERGIKVAAKWIEDAIPNKPAIGQKLSGILGEKATAEACGKAALIITDAFIFQHALAGKVGFESVRPLNYYDEAPVRHNAILADWAAVLRINYVPIFKDARQMVKEAFCYDEQMSLRVLRRLLDTAREIVKSHLPQIHELAGEIFQTLVVDRDYVKAHYTLPESAALLSALVCQDIDVGNLPKVADYACGTGALLNGVYKRVQRLYEQKTGRSSRDIHREMMENNLCGSDIYSHATHLTFAVMASAHPDVTLGATRVITAPCGDMGGGDFKTGSLELLNTAQLTFIQLEPDAEQASGDDGEATAEIKRAFPHGEMDIVIINPPFSKNADRNSGKGKAAFKGSKRSHDEEKLLRAALRKKDIRVGDGNDGLGSYFVDMADRKLKTGGTMGFILLSSIFTGTNTQKMRRMLSEEYHDVIVVTIAGNSGHDSAFSADTSLGECMVVATKGVGANTGRARFVCLTHRPDSLLSAQILARKIREQALTRKQEDAPHGGDELVIGTDVVGYAMDCPIDANEWAVSRVRAFSLMQMAYHLRHGRLHFPRLLACLSLPMCQIQDVAELNVSEPCIKNERRGDGAFQVREGISDAYETHPTLWKVHAQTQRAMQTSVNAYARIITGKENQARGILERSSRTHYHRLLCFNANSQLASFTEHPSIGASSLHNVRLNEQKHEAAWTLWTNSTFGLLCHWMHASKQAPGRGKLTWTTRWTVPTLDVRQLTDEQLAAAERIFAELKSYRMLPYNECRDDEWRHVLDARLLAEVLGITDEETHRAMQNLREMLCDEPTIAGTKLVKNFCNLEKERAKFDIAGTAEEDAAALATQQLKLRMAGIWLPYAELP